MVDGKLKCFAWPVLPIDENFAEKSKQEFQSLCDNWELIIVDDCPINCAEKMESHGKIPWYLLNNAHRGDIPIAR